MKIREYLLLGLTAVLLSSINAEKKERRMVTMDTEVVNEQQITNGKISTSLKINDTKNKTDKVRETITSATRVPEKREDIGEEVRFLLGQRNGENATRELMLPISMDITKILSDDISGDEEEGEEEEEEEEEDEVEEIEGRQVVEGAGEDEEKKANQETAEKLPEALELRYARPSTPARIRPFYRPPPPRRPSNLNRRNVYAESTRTTTLKRPSRRPTEVKRGPTEKECTFFTKTVCLEAMDYPHDAIRRSLRSNKEMTAALLTDFKVQNHGSSEESSASLPVALPLETRYENRYESNEIKRRADVSSFYDNIEEGFTCPSVIKYARPQLARAASGSWKYIINTGEHTQTIRLEKCSNPQSSCSFISENYRSSCVQVYNYHRLLTWDTKLGLHMDIFKVPTCCSCQVHGYSEIFPPHQKDPPPKPKEPFPGADFATANENTKGDPDDSVRHPGSYVTKYNPITSYDSNLGTYLDNYSPSSTAHNDLGESAYFTPVSSNKKPVIEIGPSRPTFGIVGRPRPKKPTPVPRPYDKVPQQHAPNTRAPGYTGPLVKGARPGVRPSRPPFRRESISHSEDHTESSSNSSAGSRYSQPYDQDMDASSRLQHGGFDEEYQEPPRRINYNYHPIIDFFKPEASMLQSSESEQHGLQSGPAQNNANSWKPMIAN